MNKKKATTTTTATTSNNAYPAKKYFTVATCPEVYPEPCVQYLRWSV